MNLFKKINSILLIATILMAFTSVYAFADTVKYEVTSKSSTAFEPNRAKGLTLMEIIVSKNSGTLNYYINTECSDTATQIGFRNAYVCKYVNGYLDSMISVTPGTSYNTYFNYSGRTYGMQSGAKYRIMVEHYCIINGVTYTQIQTTDEYSY